MNYTTTTLGLAICQPAALIAEGLAGCPRKLAPRLWQRGRRSAVRHRLWPRIPEVQAVSGPSPKGNLVVLFYANGLYPVYAQLDVLGRSAPGQRPLRLRTRGHRPARHERARRPRRFRRERHEHYRPEPSHLLQARPRAARVVPPPRRVRPRTLPPRRLPVRRRIHVPRRQPRERPDHRPLPACTPPAERDGWASLDAPCARSSGSEAGANTESSPRRSRSDRQSRAI